MNFGVAGQIAVAISETPLGPFVVVNPALNITRGSSGKSCCILIHSLSRTFLSRMIKKSIFSGTFY